MKAIIVGAGGSGLILALFLKRHHPEFEVEIIDKEEKLGRKLLATGNGRCNLLNMKAEPHHYNNPAFMKDVLDRYPFGELQYRLEEIPIILTNEDDLIYPLSKSASTYVSYLGKLLEEAGVKISLGEKVIDYSKDELITDKGKRKFDKLIFATGGKSKPRLGSDGSLFPVFEEHGYKVNELRPGLVPLKTKEPTKRIAGLRHKAKVHVSASGIQIHEEEGEVLFKDDGLSGIVIFNCSSYINRLGNPDVSIELDLFPEMSLQDLLKDFLSSMERNPSSFIDAYFAHPLGEYLLERAGIKDHDALGKKQAYALAKTVKGLSFSLKETYGFEDSQVTIGGISLTEVDNKTLESRRENGVYFLGEALDIDGLCGGYNLTWCLSSAFMVLDSFR